MVAAVDALFDPNPTKACSYRCVTPHNSGFRGRVKINGRNHFTGSAPTPRQAAEKVALWLQQVYGPSWPCLFRGRDARRANPWRVFRAVKIVKRTVKGRKRIVRQNLGWSASVWEGGTETVLGDHLHPADRRRDKAGRKPWVYGSREEAVAAVGHWRTEVVPRRWGLLAPYCCFR